MTTFYTFLMFVLLATVASAEPCLVRVVSDFKAYNVKIPKQRSLANQIQTYLQSTKDYTIVTAANDPFEYELTITEIYSVLHIQKENSNSTFAKMDAVPDLQLTDISGKVITISGQKVWMNTAFTTQINERENMEEVIEKSIHDMSNFLMASAESFPTCETLQNKN